MDAQKKIPEVERGRDLSRVVAFTDGVFAIAVTLLVLQLDVPKGIDSPSDLWQQVFVDQGVSFGAFLISFAVIGRYWMINHGLMRMMREFDQGMLSLLLLYLLFIVLLPFTSELLGEYGEFDLSVFVYVINLIMVAFTSTVVMIHARRADLEDPVYREELDVSIKGGWFVTAVFVITLPLVLLFGSWALLLWIPLLRLNPRERRARARRKEAG
jgi:uncharacterized membrane protein